MPPGSSPVAVPRIADARLVGPRQAEHVVVEERVAVVQEPPAPHRHDVPLGHLAEYRLW